MSSGDNKTAPVDQEKNTPRACRTCHSTCHDKNGVSYMSMNAAAPDLLRACKMIAGMAVSWEPLTPGDIAEVRAAIAKAEAHHGS